MGRGFESHRGHFFSAVTSWPATSYRTSLLYFPISTPICDNYSGDFWPVLFLQMMLSGTLMEQVICCGIFSGHYRPRPRVFLMPQMLKFSKKQTDLKDPKKPIATFATNVTNVTNATNDDQPDYCLAGLSF